MLPAPSLVNNTANNLYGKIHRTGVTYYGLKQCCVNNTTCINISYEPNICNERHFLKKCYRLITGFVTDGFITGLVTGFVIDGFGVGLVTGFVIDGFVTGLVTGLVIVGFVTGLVTGLVIVGFVTGLVTGLVIVGFVTGLVTGLVIVGFVTGLVTGFGCRGLPVLSKEGNLSFTDGAFGKSFLNCSEPFLASSGLEYVFL